MRASRLPEKLIDELDAFGALPRRRAAALNLGALTAALSELPCAAVAIAELEARVRANLFKVRRPTGWLRLFGSGDDLKELARNPELAFLFLFHGDGHVREAALARLACALPSAFFVAALARRANDWVQQVRYVAEAAILRCYPATDARYLAEAALFLLDRGRHWRRWGAARESVYQALMQPQVGALLADRIVTASKGPMARVLVSALRSPEMDASLDRLASDAVQPAVRAVAITTMLRREARWPQGSERRWIDKVAGIWAPVTVFAARPVDCPRSRLSLLEQAAADRSSIVRRVAAQSLIEEPGRDEAEFGILRRLGTDRSAAVRERAEFALRRASGSSSSHRPSN